jgi:hypothetical protein
MATVNTHPLEALRPREVIATIKATGAADVETNGFTINENPHNIVSTFARSAEGEITVTLVQKWAALSNCIVTCSIDDTNVTLDAETVATTKTIKFTTVTGGAAADADSGVIRATLVLRLQ